jgi:hypothetical protein
VGETHGYVGLGLGESYKSMGATVTPQKSVTTPPTPPFFTAYTASQID